MMKRAITILLLIMTISVSYAGGWHDYSLDIGDEYAIGRCNPLDIVLSDPNNYILIGPGERDPVGPIVEYATTEQFIFTRNFGKKLRNLYEGDTFYEIDPEQEYFFVLKKSTNKVTGPLTKQAFNEFPEVKKAASIDWKTPKNPNIWLPFFGDIMFLAVGIPILAIKFFWITIPVIIVIIFFIGCGVKKRKQAA